jgi:ubiquitin thioesterase OTU1
MTADQCWVYRRIIEANDSCLFNALGYSLLNSLKKAPKLRKIVADRVLADKFLYDSATLGKSPEDYAKWI